MEEKQISGGSIYTELPPLSPNYSWLVTQNLTAEEDEVGQIFYTIDDPKTQYRCRIPELHGRRIQGCFHGWVILSDYPENVMWSLWNPLTSRIIRLPPLIDNKDEEEKEKGGLEEATDKEEEDTDEAEDTDDDEEEEEDTDEEDEEEEDWHECCLSSPPDDPNSIFLLATSKKTFRFCRLDCKRERLRWTEMSYDEQLRSITNNEDSFLFFLTYCNGKVYALYTRPADYDIFVVHIEIVVQDREVVIRLLPLVKCPSAPEYCSNNPILKGSCSELFLIYICMRFNYCYVYCHKLDMTSMLWEEITDLKDASLYFVDMCHDDSVNYSPAIASELGGYIHMIDKMEEVIYSYNVKDKTLTPSSISHLDLPQRSGESQSYVSVWAMPERRLQVDNGKIKHTVDRKLEEKKGNKVVHDGVEVDGVLNQHQESPLFNIPVHVLERIMEFSVGVDYLNFRATCKRFSSITVSKRRVLSTLLSPWLMAFDKVKGIFTFTDPVFGDRYFIRAPLDFVGDVHIHCSMCGWLLMSTDTRGGLMLFNPFTHDIHKLPNLEIPHPNTFCFSEPPTSPTCMVVALTCIGEWHVYIHFVYQEHSWRKLQMDFHGMDPSHAFAFPTFYGRDIYALNDGGLNIFQETKEKDYTHGVVVAKPPRSSISTEYFLVKRNKRLLLVAVDEHGRSLKLFELNHTTGAWKKIHGLGNYMIYICYTTCFCVRARTPEMKNKIYFQRFHSESGKILFYSLETCRYHTFNRKIIHDGFDNFYGTKEVLCPQAWIEPSLP